MKSERGINSGLLVVHSSDTESECHSDYELTQSLIRLPAITSFTNPGACHENARLLYSGLVHD